MDFTGGESRVCVVKLPESSHHLLNSFQVYSLWETYTNQLDKGHVKYEAKYKLFFFSEVLCSRII